MRQQSVELFVELVKATGRRGRDIIEPMIGLHSGWPEHEVERRAIGRVFGQLAVKHRLRRHGPIAQHRLQRLRNEPALLLDSARDEVAHLAIAHLELPIENNGQGHEDADQHDEFDRQ